MPQKVNVLGILTLEMALLEFLIVLRKSTICISYDADQEQSV